MTASQSRPAAIVVLGARLHPDGSPTVSLVRRVGVGIELYRAAAAPRLLVTGGGARQRPEAEAMAEAALAAGVPAAALLVERRSANTIENAFFSAALLRAHGLGGTVLLVTDRYHLPRARWLFARAGLRVDGVAAPADAAGAWRMWLREGAALPRSWWRLRRGPPAGPEERTREA
ncbi:MAG: YdcF family protein [Dongiaceae bacterium]